MYPQAQQKYLAYVTDKCHKWINEYVNVEVGYLHQIISMQKKQKQNLKID